nr:PREDICTED: nucleolin 2-like [Megachile rotundata]
MSYAKFSFSLYITFSCLILSLVNASIQTSSKTTFAEQLTEENWDRMLIGEWMVEFYAPWCPACKALEPIWEHLASQKKNLDINVGKVDVTDSPGLSGRFMVTALPTIYHVKDGIFRQYKSPRDKDSLIEFVSEKTWEKIEPVPGWKSPTSIQMSVISQFFKMSQVLRGIHNKLMEDFGLPTWGSYLIFAIATIVLGAILGLCIVCLIDFIYPPKPVMLQDKKKHKEGSGGFMQEKTIQDEEIVENVKDDLVDEDSEQEGSDTEGKEKDVDKDSKTEPSSPNVRKRKPRKADYMIKNAKKRSVSETEVTDKKAEATGKNKVFKKNKTEKTVQNGQPDKQAKKDISKKVKVGRKKNKDVNASPKNDDKGKKRFRDKDTFSAEELKTKIEEITNRGELSKTARRKLAFLKKLLRIKEGKPVESKQQLQNTKNAKSLEVAKNKQNKKSKGQLETKSQNQNKGKNTKQQKKDEDEDEDEDEEEDTDLSEDENESDLEEEEEEENESGEEDEDDEEEESEDDEDDEDEDEDEDDENENEKVKTNNVQPKKGKESNTNEGEAKKKRYVVFVGNLPYTITSEELKKHFLTKVSHVVDIRIPTKDDKSPRGFAYVEFADNADFEKAFTLHHSMINGRRINVQYSGANKKEGVAKNFKLQALQKAGKFGGGKNKPFQKKFNKGK